MRHRAASRMLHRRLHPSRLLDNGDPLACYAFASNNISNWLCATVHLSAAAQHAPCRQLANLTGSAAYRLFAAGCWADAPAAGGPRIVIMAKVAPQPAVRCMNF